MLGFVLSAFPPGRLRIPGPTPQKQNRTYMLGFALSAFPPGIEPGSTPYLPAIACALGRKDNHSYLAISKEKRSVPLDFSLSVPSVGIEPTSRA